MSFTATLMFIAYSILNGATLVDLPVYTASSIASTFFVTAGTFGAMALFGYFTKRDLSGIGNMGYMALIGIIIATVVNLFLRSETMMWVITYIGVLVFVALTAYDTQKIKKMVMNAEVVDESTQKIALLGSLTLYLDFINLFSTCSGFSGAVSRQAPAT
ncbi:MAG: Bax inhibitor-1/YccA family protein [Alistipes onderdonkii]